MGKRATPKAAIELVNSVVNVPGLSVAVGFVGSIGFVNPATAAKSSALISSVSDPRLIEPSSSAPKIVAL